MSLLLFYCCTQAGVLLDNLREDLNVGSLTIIAVGLESPEVIRIEWSSSECWANCFSGGISEGCRGAVVVRKDSRVEATAYSISFYHSLIPSQSLSLLNSQHYTRIALIP